VVTTLLAAAPGVAASMEAMLHKLHTLSEQQQVLVEATGMLPAAAKKAARAMKVNFSKARRPSAASSLAGSTLAIWHPAVLWQAMLPCPALLYPAVVFISSNRQADNPCTPRYRIVILL